MTYPHFKKESIEWNLSPHFSERMRRALTGISSVAKVDPNLITKNDLKFLKHFGYELNVGRMEVAV